MKFSTIKIATRFFFSFFGALAIILGCSKDIDEPYDGLETAMAKKISLQAQTIQAVISGTLPKGLVPSSGQAPFEVDFKAWNSKNQNNIKSYSWDFGDGSTTRTKNPSHTFSKPGDYTVKLTVKDKGGYTHSATHDIAISGLESGKTSAATTGNYPSHAVYASSYGFRAGDATAAFEAAIKSGKSFVVIDKQSSDWVIRPTRFYDLQNMTIVFEPGVTLRAKSGAFREGQRLFQLTRAKDVTIEGTGATFRMNKNEYTSGEQRHALEIDISSDVTVRGLTIRDSGGAGIAIKGDRYSGYSQNITIENIRSLNNRRDGITITSAQNVWVRNSEFSQSRGTKPEAGVVLETDRASQRLVNINFINCKFSDNNSAGIHFSTTKMNGSSRPVSVKVVDSEFSNNAVSPFHGVPATEIYVGGGRGTDVVGGEVRFERSKFNGSPGRIVFTRKSGNGFKTVFKDCEARNVVSSTSASPISLEGSSDRNTAGGMVFDNFYIQYSRNVPFMHINAPSRNGSFDVKNLSGSFTIKDPYNYPLKYSGGYQPGKNVNVSINYNHI